MSSRAARIAVLVLAVVLVVVGGLWIGQGLGLIPGSVMTGDRTWFYVGTVLVVVGVGVGVVGTRLSRRH